MKAMMILKAALFFASITTPAMAQAHPARISLELGSVTIWLGMPEAEALRKFQSAGYKLDSHPVKISKIDQFIVMNEAEKTDGIPQTFVTAFRDGKLFYADRDWPIAGNDTNDTMDSIIRALGTLTSDTPTFCTVTSSPISNPNMRAGRIVIDCDSRSVVLTKGKIKDGNNFADNTQVEEQIGHLQ